jgi:hypothetical protein
MMKNGKEYRIVDMDNDPDWPCYCSHPHCLANIGSTGLKEITYPEEHRQTFGVNGVLRRKFYCLHCLPKMFTEDEIETLNNERRERIKIEIEEYRKERVKTGYMW